MSLIKPFNEAELELIDAMRSTWHSIAGDCGEMFEDGIADVDSIIELVCDANRIAMYGGPRGAELDKLQFNLYCSNHDRFLEIAHAAFPQAYAM